MIVIPSIDVLGGKCVRLTQGDFSRVTEYAGDPLAVAQSFEDAGLTHLHLVDLDGAREGAVQNWATLEALAKGTSLHIDFGGGLKTTEAVQRAFDAGARQVNIGSLAVRNRLLMLEWIDTFGPSRIILSADVREGRIAISGWQEGTQIDVFQFLADYAKAGIETVACTDISRDGGLAGPAHDLYASLRARFPRLRLLASGGVHRLRDLEQLRAEGLYGAIIGKAIFENTIPLAQLAAFAAAGDEPEGETPR